LGHANDPDLPAMADLIPAPGQAERTEGTPTAGTDSSIRLQAGSQ
jgi:hypothetical protein